MSSFDLEEKAGGIDTHRQEGILQIGVCGLTQIGLHTEANDDPQDGIEEDEGSRGASETASDVESHCGGEDISGGEERERGIRALKQLEDTERSCEITDCRERNVIRKREAHSFSLVQMELLKY